MVRQNKNVVKRVSAAEFSGFLPRALTGVLVRLARSCGRVSRRRGRDNCLPPRDAYKVQISHFRYITSLRRRRCRGHSFWRFCGVPLGLVPINRHTVETAPMRGSPDGFGYLWWGTASVSWLGEFRGPPPRSGHQEIDDATFTGLMGLGSLSWGL